MSYFTSTIYNLTVSFLSFIFSWLPTSTGFSTSFHTSASTIGAQLNVLNIILPIDELVIILGLTFTYFFVLQSIYFIMWVIELLRG